MKWTPQPVGFYVQNGKLGLMFVVSSTESDFRNQVNFISLQGMADRMDEIQEMVGADHKAFSGILPNVMKRSGIKTNVTPEATVMAVTEATINLMNMESIPDSTAVYILGGHGYIGKRVIRELSDRGIIVLSVNTSSGNDGLTTLPDSLPKSKHLVVNIASPNALKGSIRHLQEGTIVLNEAYPEPDAETIASLKEVGCHLYHVVGVKAKACPQFPYAYRGGIPCCAAWPSPDAKVNVMRLA